MELNDVPVRLGKERAEEWKAYILGRLEYALDLEEETEEEEAEELAEIKEEGTEESNKKEPKPEKVLEDRLTQELGGSMRSRLSKFLNGHGEELYQWLKPGSKFGAALQRILSLDVEVVRARLIALVKVEPEDFDKLQLVPLRFVPKSDTSLFLQMSNREPWIGWEELREQFPDGSFEFDSRRPVTREIAALNPLICVSGTNVIRITVDELKEEDLNSWVTHLSAAGLISRQQRDRLRAPECLRLLLSAWSASEFRNITDDILNGRLEQFTPRAVAIRRLNWAREALRRNAKDSLLERWIESEDATGFALKWLRLTGDIWLPINRRDLGLLFPNSPEEQIDVSELLNCLRAGLSNQDILRRFSQDVMEDILGAKWILHGDAGYTLGPELADFAWAALVLNLQPEDLRQIRLFGQGSDFQLVAEAVAASQDPAGFLQIATESSRPDLPYLLMAVALGLSKQQCEFAPMDEEDLQKFWISTVWCAAANEVYLQHIALEISQDFSKYLPLMDISDVQDWLLPCAVEFTSKLGLQTPAELEIYLHMPFQIRSSYWLHPDIGPIWEIRTDLLRTSALKGDKGARRKIVEEDFESIFGDTSPRFEIDGIDLLDWMSEGGFERDLGHWLEKSLEAGIQRYIDGATQLEPVLRSALKTTDRLQWLSRLVAACNQLGTSEFQEAKQTLDQRFFDVINEFQDVFEWNDGDFHQPPRLIAHRWVGELKPEVLEVALKLAQHSDLLASFFNGTFRLPENPEWHEWALQDSRYARNWIVRGGSPEDLLHKASAIDACWDLLDEKYKKLSLASVNSAEWPNDLWWQRAKPYWPISHRLVRWRTHKGTPIDVVGEAKELMAELDALTSSERYPPRHWHSVHRILEGLLEMIYAEPQKHSGWTVSSTVQATLLCLFRTESKHIGERTLVFETLRGMIIRGEFRLEKNPEKVSSWLFAEKLKGFAQMVDWPERDEALRVAFLRDLSFPDLPSEYSFPEDDSHSRKKLKNLIVEQFTRKEMQSHQDILRFLPWIEDDQKLFKSVIEKLVMESAPLNDKLDCLTGLRLHVGHESLKFLEEQIDQLWSS